MPTSVIKGMLAAIGILLIIKQPPLAAGLAPGAGAGASSGAGTVAGTAGAALLSTPFGGVSVAAALVALASLVLLLGWDTRTLRRFRWVRAAPRRSQL